MADITWQDRITETDPTFLAQECTRLEARASLLFGIAADALGSPLKVYELLQQSEAALRDRDRELMSISTHSPRKR